MKQTEQMRKLGWDTGLLTQCIERFWGWARYRDDPPEHVGSCALCTEYFKPVACTCGGCPVAEDGHVRCRGTPYLELARSLHPDRTGGGRYTPRASGGLRPIGMTAGDAADELAYLARLRDRLAARLRLLEEMAQVAERKQATRQRAAEARQDAENAAARVEAEAEKNVAAAEVASARSAEAELRVMKLRLGRLIEVFLVCVPSSGEFPAPADRLVGDVKAIRQELGMHEFEKL